MEDTKQVDTVSKIPWGSDDITDTFRVLQNTLTHVACPGKAVNEICSVMMTEDLIDFPDVQGILASSDEKQNLQDLVLKFMNR